MEMRVRDIAHIRFFQWKKMLERKVAPLRNSARTIYLLHGRLVKYLAIFTNLLPILIIHSYVFRTRITQFLGRLILCRSTVAILYFPRSRPFCG